MQAMEELAPPTTLLTSTHPNIPTSAIAAGAQKTQRVWSGYYQAYEQPLHSSVRLQDDGSTMNGVVIGLLSSFGSAAFIGLIFLIIYFFRYTTGGRILLDRIGRPGEYDDEQAYAREEAEALEEMDDLQRTEYLRAKGMCFGTFKLYS